MKKRSMMAVFAMTAMVLSMAFGSGKVMAAEAADSVQLQILATSDVHGKMAPYDYALNEVSTSGSSTQIATAVKALRNDNTIVIDAGDTIQDNSAELFLNDTIHPMIMAMNEIGYDVWVAGNHEFNFGMDTLLGILPQSNARFLCGNVYSPDGTPLGEDYMIIEKGGIRVGLIGMVTPNITRWDAENLKGWQVTNPVEETKAAIAELQDKVDVLVAVEHMMVENEYDVAGSGVADLANACPELDLIIAAHGHQAIEDEVINGVPIVENKNGGATMAQILIDVERDEDGSWAVTDVNRKLHDISKYAVDKDLAEKLVVPHVRAVMNAETVIAKLEGGSLAPENEIKEIPTAQIQDTALVDLINEVQMHYTGADISAAALFVNDANMHPGDIKKCDMALVYKYANTLYKMKINGAQLKQYMEWSASYYNTYQPGDLTVSFNPKMRGYLYDMFAGVNYEINIANEPGSRIENLTKKDGTPVKDTDEFIMAVNNYRASSQLASYGAVFQEGQELPKILEIDVCGDIGGVRELIGDYILKEKGGVLTPETDNNWKITGTDWDEEQHQKAVEQLKAGILTIPSSADGRTSNVKAITVADLK